MKIIYLHQYFKTPKENGGTRSYDLAKSFVVRGYQVEMVTTTSIEKGFENGKWKIENIDGIKVHYLYLPYDNSFSFLKRGVVFFRFLILSSLKLLSIKGDVVLATSTPLTIAVPALVKKLVHRTPYIFEVRDVWPEAVIAIGAVKNKIFQKILYALEAIAYKYAKFIVPLSEDMQRSIVNRYPKFAYKTEMVIENIAEIKRFNREDLREKQLIKNLIGFIPRFPILYAGTFGKVNHIDYVIHLAKRLLEFEAGIVFLLLGNGSEKKVLVQEAKELGVFEKNIFFLSPVNKQQLPELYRNVSMGSSFVAPIKQLWANSANKFFDTLAAGKPILINHYGWQSDVIKDKNVGYVLPPNIEDVNLEEFVAFTKDEKMIESSGYNARKLATENYSLIIAVNKYLTLLER